MGQGETQSQQFNLQGLMQHENAGINSKIIVQKKSYWAFQEGKGWALYQAQIIHPWSWAWREDQHEGVKVTRGGGSVYTACCSLPVGLYTQRATHAPTQTESRTRSELKWNFKRNAESTGREKLIPQEERGWWVSRQLKHLLQLNPLVLWGQASSRHICTTWRHSRPRGLE